MTKDNGNEQIQETLTLSEGIDDDNHSTEETIGISSTLTLTVRSKSTPFSKTQSQPLYAVKGISHEGTAKRSCSKQLFPSTSDGNQGMMILSKSSILTNKDLAKDMKLSLRDMKQLFISIDKLDTKLINI